MRNKIGYDKLYIIINDAISKCYNTKDISVKANMLNYIDNYNAFFRSGETLDIFDELLPTKDEVTKAKKFCSLLNKFRLSIDVHNPKAYPLSNDEYQTIYDLLQEYRPHIADKNLQTFGILEKAVKRHHPQYREEIILDELIAKASSIIKKSNKNKKNKIESVEDEIKSDSLTVFEDIEREKVKSFKSSPSKLELYTKCIKLVDYLPKRNFGRLVKFRAKYNLNKALFIISKELGGEYELKSNEYQSEMQKFVRAIDTTIDYMSKNKPNSDFNKKRNDEDYWCK